MDGDASPVDSPEKAGEEGSKANGQTQPLQQLPEKELVLVDRRVIDEDLIRAAVIQDLEANETGMLLKAEEVDLEQLVELSLSFKNIYAIDNLMGFETLVKLQLDNNIIDRIQNLDHLVNLEWLDLSFNNISKIENLDKLTKLQDLSLFNNRITSIEGLDQLTQLNVLSLGNNSIDNLESVKDLRKFPNLRLLNLKGNPVCQDDDYQNTIFAYLTKLKYLDYELIEASQVVKARDTKLDQLVELEAREKEEAADREEAKKGEERLALLARANLEGLDTLLANVIQSDGEYQKLKILPGYHDILEEYQAMCKKITDAFADKILKKHVVKEEEKNLFKSVVDKASRENEEHSIAALQDFEAKKKKAFSAFAKSREERAPKPELLDSLRGEVETLSDHLMDLEMLLVETLNDVMDEFEDAYKALIQENLTEIASSFRELGECVNWYVDALNKLVHDLMDKMANTDGKPGGDESPDVTALLSDRDAVLTAVSTSQDNHLAKILAKEDEIREREDTLSKNFVKDSRQDEYERNRYRVAEIHELIARYNSTIQQTLDFDDELEDEYGDDGYAYRGN